ncbi:MULTISPECIES: hypothetical protein [unclassified Streptomyces]|uniref:hypothetical protein n=1 Tax=unclassified Streptomyces TaxID=2593676 RepID=UPI0033AECCA4
MSSHRSGPHPDAASARPLPAPRVETLAAMAAIAPCAAPAPGFLRSSDDVGWNASGSGG